MNSSSTPCENTSNNINDKALECNKQNGNKIESRICPKDAQYISELILNKDNKIEINKTQNIDSYNSTEMSVSINNVCIDQEQKNKKFSINNETDVPLYNKKNNEEFETNYNINKNKDISPKLGEKYCKSIDEENEYIEDWEVIRKRIFDPTLGLRKHYAKEFLSCGEKYNTRILEKWSSMIDRNINWFMKAHKTTFLRRVKRGIPQKYRWKVWMHITNSISLINKFEKKYYYLYKKTSNYSNLIYIDISRTFPELLIFDKYAQDQLYRILNAYANYESSVGYCQGMNFIVGLLLIVSNFNELETFCILVSLMNNYHLKNFYKEQFPLLNRFIYVFEKILKFEIPDLFEHFNNEEVHPPVYLHQWLLTLFIASLPIKSVIIIWDYLFSTSIKMILIISVALLKILKNYLVKNNFEKILKLLKSMKYNESNDDILIAKLLIKKSEFVILNTGLAYIFENIEKEDIPLDVKFKFSINNITNFHFKTVTSNYSKNEFENNDENKNNNTTFSDLDGASLLNFFSTNILPKGHYNQIKEEDKELKQNANYDLKNVEKTESQTNINEIYYKMLRSNEKNKINNESDNDSPYEQKQNNEKIEDSGFYNKKENNIYNYEFIKHDQDANNYEYKDFQNISNSKNFTNQTTASIVNTNSEKNEIKQNNNSSHIIYANRCEDTDSKKINYEKYNSINVKNDKKKKSENIKRHAYYYKSDGFYDENQNCQNNNDNILATNNNYIITNKTKQTRQKLSDDEKRDICFAQEFRKENKKSQNNIIDKTKIKNQFKYNDKDIEQNGEQTQISDNSEEFAYTGTNNDKEESILNISEYINNNSNDNNEMQNNSEENGLSFFNLIQTYTKDNSWFDVSSINKYYNFNKKRSDFELDSMGINKKENFEDSN
ncbi:GTPase-activating protein, putative [Plasmodium berghei]|uniref:GTPase-activating protein, putative n=2 Tax=Plasmodium berghei TaxID=5821 RepID=A0A509AH56_PLABA|nr:GTPase-activating protein, putative [Plasmodium berghei ANKA]CXI30560.1 GTPase-activating protein, putative [Plasmodium berghei]SCM20877.1 GTPase-activating protein, putative [Plasmodium berghei]SCN24365.1 GTPase-activating protein, putative [Plasmodium berghei]SCO59536.1 GTPase-activating protein, putative [Plasmodium berghei]SCO60756.1 GTPase-activating protein, putative [Plasmodium berghei]|eukprot:XP_034421058.1 GTPase-activating protein, putative [Plasmodium berghei ANKA]